MYLVKENFKHKYLTFKIGEHIDPAIVKAKLLDKDGKEYLAQAFSKEDCEMLLKEGLIVKQADAVLKDMANLDAQIAKKKSELSALEAQCKTLKEKLPAKEPSKKE